MTAEESWRKILEEYDATRAVLLQNEARRMLARDHAGRQIYYERVREARGSAGLRELIAAVKELYRVSGDRPQSA